MSIALRIFLSLIILFPELKLVSEQDKPFSPIAMEMDENEAVLAIAGRTSNELRLINAYNFKTVKKVKTELPPTGIVYGKNSFWATVTFGKGYIQEIYPNGKKGTKIKVGHGACAPVFHPSEPIIYVANQFDDDVSVVDVENYVERKRIKVQRQPVAQTLSKCGNFLFVANLLPKGRADADTMASSVSVIDTKRGIKIKDLQLANGSNALRDIQISDDGKYVFTTHNLGRFQVPTSQLAQGWMNTSAISIIDVKKLEFVATVLLDQPQKGAAGSWGIDLNSEYIFIAHSGTHDFSRIRYADFINGVLQYENKERLSYDLRFLQQYRERFNVNGNGPRDILLAKDKLFITNYFTDNLEVVEIDKEMDEHRLISLNEGYTPDSARLGEQIFNDARHCFQGWQSCNGCHPNDARIDGLNWDLLNDGIGNPKNCKSLLYSHFTAPSMITGVRATAEIAVRAGFKHIQFAHVSEDDARKVDCYLKSLKPVPSPYLSENGQLTEKALNGKVVFEKLNCQHCHNGPYYTNYKKYEMGRQGEYDKQNTWDTPTLIEVWRTAPYLHDGRCETLEGIFKDENHGLKNKKLTQTELNQLVAYLNSL